jgi:tetratricopeptide (TPR) repeat protein
MLLNKNRFQTSFFIVVFLVAILFNGCSTIDQSYEISKTAINHSLTKTKSKINYGFSTLEAKFDRQYAIRQYNARNYEEAEYYFKQFLVAKPGDGEALKYLAWSQFFQARFDKAAHSFQRAKSLFPKDPQVYIGLGWSYLAIKDYETALKKFDRAKFYKADPYIVYKGKGFAYLKLLDLESARKELSELYAPEDINSISTKWKTVPINSYAEYDINSIVKQDFRKIFTLKEERPRYRGSMLAFQPFESSAELDEAWRILRFGNVKKALKTFEGLYQAGKLDSANGLAWSYVQNGKFLEAEALFKEILEQFNGFPGAEEGLSTVKSIKRDKAAYADYYFNLDKLIIAKNKFRQLKGKYPDWEYPYLNLGIIDIKTDRFSDAESHFRKALEINPNFKAAQLGINEIYKITAPLLLRGNEELSKGNYIEASRNFMDYIDSTDNLIQSPHSLAEAYNGFGWSYYGKKQYELAIRKFKIAIDHDRFQFDAALGLGLSHYNLNDYKKSAEYLELADSIKPERKNIRYKLDWSILQSYSLKEAKEIFLENIIRDPLRASSYMGLGWIYYTANKPDLAVEFFVKAITLDPDFAMTEEFSKVLDLERFGWQVYNQFGWAYYRQERYDKANYIFQVALNRKPDSSETFKGLGFTSFKLKNYNKSILYLKQSAILNKDLKNVEELVKDGSAIAPYKTETSVQTKLGWSYFNLGQYNRAISVFNEELGKNPDWTSIYEGLGWSYLKLKKLAQSRAAFSKAIRLQPLNNSAHYGLNQAKQLAIREKLKRKEVGKKLSGGQILNRQAL